MNRETVLVTGAGGFIGHHLVGYLKRKGYRVRGVDIKEPEFAPTEADEFMLLDLRQRENCDTACQGVDTVYGLAADMGGMGFISANHVQILRNNLLINTHMLDAAQRAGVGRYFFSSSACVYPEYRQEEADVVPLKEEDAYPADPDNFYGWEKLYTEKMCEAYQRDYNMDIRILRYHNIYGPEGTYTGGKEKSPAALCRKVAEATNPGSIEIWGDGKQTRSYCYVDDAVKATNLLMESDYDKPINIGSDRLVTINKLADMIIEVSGKKITKTYNPTAPQGVRGRNADLTLVTKVLNWQPQVTLEQGLAKTYEWIKKQVDSDKRE